MLYSKLLEYGFIRSYVDYSLFTYTRDGKFMALLVYVDDVMLTGNNQAICSAFKAYLHSCFRIKDLGLLKYFLGIDVARSPQGLFLSQRKYTLEIIEECGLLGAKPADFPMETNHKLGLATGNMLDDPPPYR